MQDLNKQSQYNIIVADDHQLFRNGLVATLRIIKSVGQMVQAIDGIEVMDKLKNLAIDVNLIFMDINMPGMNGIATTREVKELYPAIKVIALSMHDDPKHVIEMFKAGANGYLLKNTDKKEIANAIDEVMDGKYFYGKGVSTTILDTRLEKSGNKEIEVVSIQLLPKEIEVLEMIYQELSTKEIAERLQVSHRTVEGYRQLLFQKTNTQNLTGLIKFATRNGFTGEGKNYRL